MTARTFRFTHWLQRGDDEIEVAVTYSATPFVMSTHWQPTEGAEVRFIEAAPPTDAAPLTDAEETAIFNACEYRAPTDLAEHDRGATEYRAEQRADDLMVERWENEL